MPRFKSQIPKLSRHARGHAFVKIGGHQVWLGRYGAPLTQEKYDRIVAEWLANGRRLPLRNEPEEPTTVHMVMAEYWRWAKTRYGKTEAQTIQAALRIVKRLYGSADANRFGPKRLRAVRAEMIRMDWSRSHINKQVSRVRSMFKWAVANELVPETVYRRLSALEPLQRGEAKERPKVTPVPRSHVRRVRQHLSRQVRSIIDLQLLTCARAGELAKLRAIDLDMSGPVWVYRPDQHKTAHHGKDKAIYFGPKSQRILRMFLVPARPVDACLFSPREAEAQRHANATMHRRSNQKTNRRRTDRTLGDRYTTPSYRRAIHRACRKANVAEWSPHRLRHTAATFVRREFGIEAAQIMLGHASVTATQVYAEANTLRAIEVAMKVG